MFFIHEITLYEIYLSEHGSYKINFIEGFFMLSRFYCKIGLPKRNYLILVKISWNNFPFVSYITPVTETIPPVYSGSPEPAWTGLPAVKYYI